MKEGKAPLGADEFPMEIHHVDRTPEGPKKPMTRTDHRLGENYKKNHPAAPKKDPLKAAPSGVKGGFTK